MGSRLPGFNCYYILSTLNLEPEKVMLLCMKTSLNKIAIERSESTNNVCLSNRELIQFKLNYSRFVMRAWVSKGQTLINWGNSLIKSLATLSSEICGRDKYFKEIYQVSCSAIRLQDRKCKTYYKGARVKAKGERLVWSQ